MSGEHNHYQKLGSTDMVECGTCGYPLLPEERMGLVEVGGKMVKPWVKLTGDELLELFRDDPGCFGYGRAIEAKLKEKNGVLA